MAEQTQSLQELVNSLPEELQQEVRDFAAFLVYRHQKATQHQVIHKWLGALSDVGEGLDSVELQHKITHEWRDEDIT